MKRFDFSVIITIAVISLFTAISCNSTTEQSKQDISGKAGEIAVVAAKDQWEAEPGTAIRDILAAECDYLPQKEPLYSLFNVPPQSFNKVFQVHRNILMVKINDDQTEPQISYANDVWAQPQLVVTISAKSELEAADYVREHGKVLVDLYEKAERDRVIANSIQFEEKSLREYVNARVGGSPYFPTGYSLKKQATDFIWISYETSFTNQGIFIYNFPFEGTFQLTPEYLVAKRDEVLQENVPATSDNSYMITNPTIIPGFKTRKVNGLQCVELRSLWDTHNDFMGGPFVQRAYITPDQREIVVIEGFVYAPKYNKRNYLRQVDYIISSFSWDNFVKK